MESASTTLCQICLGHLELPINLFESSHSDLLDVLQRLLTFQVYVEGKKFNVCRHCQEKLISIFEFQIICLKSLEPLQNPDIKPVCFAEDLPQQNNIKTERCCSPVTNKLNNLEVRLTRCSEVDGIVSTKRKRRTRTSLDKRVVDLDDQINDDFLLGDNSDGDSDYQVSDDSAKKRKSKPEVKAKRTRRRQNEVPCRLFLEQVDYNEVLQAIQEVNSTTVKITKCILCAFVGKRDQIVFHMTRAHKSVVNWCKHCNIQVEDLQKHRDAVQCHIFTCKFCNKTFATKISRFTAHVKLHCHTKVADVPLRLKQYPADKVLQAIKEIRVPADGKRRQCALCGFKGEDVFKLKIHMDLKHNDEFGKWCKYCNTISEDLQKHRDDEKCYGERCKFCNQSYEKTKSLSQHLRHHCRKELYRKINGSLMPLEAKPSSKKTRSGILKEEYFDQHKVNLEVDLEDTQNDIIKVDIPTINNNNKSHKRTDNKQFPHAVVLQTIKEAQSYCTDMKNRRCFLCNFIGGTSHSLKNHMKLKHKDVENWCKNCNIQVEDLQKHCDTERCHIWTCKLCLKTCSRMKGLIAHIKTHCHSRIANASLRLQQFSVQEVLQATREIRFPLDVKRRQCVLCDFFGTEVGNLKIHMSAKHNVECNNWCEYCNMISEDLAKHRDADECYGEQCKFCDITFGNVHSLRQHLKLHCRQKQCNTCKKFICKCIKNEETKLVKVNKRVRNTGPKSKSEIKTNIVGYCTVCSKYVYSLKWHMIRQHNAPNNRIRRIAGQSKDKKHLCPFCGKIFKTESGANCHIASHNGEPKYQCATCGKAFFHQLRLKAHEGHCNGKEKPFVCPICAKKTIGKSNHMRHLETHEGGPVQCTICNKEFHRPGVLKLHMRLHTGENRFHCIPCGKSFHIKSLLIKHMDVHKNDDDRPYSCTFCGKGFKGKETLHGHTKIHTGEKRYKCSVCPFRCIQAHGLTTHMKQHPEDAPQANKPHKCPLCFRSFSTNALLLSHINNYHADDLKKMK